MPKDQLSTDHLLGIERERVIDDSGLFGHEIEAITNLVEILLENDKP